MKKQAAIIATSFGVGAGAGALSAGKSTHPPAAPVWHEISGVVKDADGIVPPDSLVVIGATVSLERYEPWTCYVTAPAGGVYRVMVPRGSAVKTWVTDWRWPAK